MSETKQHIAKTIKRGISSRGLSLRKLADKVDMHHPQIVRMTNEENYTIDSLLKVLDELGLEIQIKDKIK